MRSFAIGVASALVGDILILVLWKVRVKGTEVCQIAKRHSFLVLDVVFMC